MSLNTFYKIEKDKIICQLCQHYCKLKNNQIGICGVNKNINNKLENLVYGKISAINIDPIEKKPLYHFLPSSKSLSIGTVGCNFKCPFCQNWQISQSSNIDNSTQITPKEVVDISLKYGCKSISYTYNEPTIFYPFAKDIAIIAKKAGLKNIFVSNGLETKEIIEDMQGIIDAFNIDIKSFYAKYYKTDLKGNLNGVLDTLKLIKSKNFWLECTTLVIPEENDSYKQIKEIGDFISKELGKDTPWHLSAFYPNYKKQNKQTTPFRTLLIAYNIAKESQLENVYLGNVAFTNITYCPNCKSELIKRDGYNILKNIIKDNKCPKCNNKIAGIWR